MKTNFAKRLCALSLAMLMVFSMFPVSVFATEISAEQAVTDTEAATDAAKTTQEEKQEASAVPDDAVSISSAAELEQALEDKKDKLCIIADFSVDRTFYITHSVSIYSASARTIKRAEDFAGDIFVVGEASDGTVCDERVVLTVGNPASTAKDQLTFNGNSENMTVAVTGAVFFVCANGQVDLHGDLTVTNCKKTGNVRALDKTRYALCNDRTVIGGAVGIICEGATDAADGVMNIYGGKYTYNGVETSGLYGGAFFNHGKMNVYDGEFTHNFAERAGVFYNYRSMKIYKAVITDNTATSLGGAIYLPASSGAVLTVGEGAVQDTTPVIFKNNSAPTGGAVSNSGKITLYNTLFEANTSTKNAGAIYSNGKYNLVEAYGCTFTLNKSGENGGAIYITGKRTSGDTEADVRNSTFAENEASGNGGAVYLTGTSRAYFRETSFNKNKAVYGGAVHVNNAELNSNLSAFSQNTATASGGGVFMEENAKAVMNKITASKNSADSHGGFLYSGAGELKMFDSSINENTAETGSALRFFTSAAADIYNCSFENNVCNEATTGNAGAIFVYTGGTKVTLNGCTLKNNTTSGFGGAILVSGKSILDLFNVTAIGNKAFKGGFMYETTSGTVVTMSGVTVSGNTVNNASGAGGPVIWGNTPNAKLYINKNNYTDSDETGALDEAYWAKAIYNKLTVYDSDAAVPEQEIYDQPEFDKTAAPDVKTAKQLEDAINAGIEKIRILRSFEIDRTFYVAKSVEIYSEAPVILTRKADFAGDIFVVGEDEKGVTSESKVVLSVGIKDTEKSDMLIIDGNKDNMTVDVKGTVFFVGTNGQVDLYGDLTVRNCEKKGNERALDKDKYTLSGSPKNVGGAVGIIADTGAVTGEIKNAEGGVMNIYGGKYYSNGVSGSGVYGGAFFNHRRMNVYDGIFEDNFASRAGAIYNYRTLYVYKATFENNTATTSGGAIYVPASSGAHLYLGEKDSENEVYFISNSGEYGGAVYTSGRNLTAYNTVFSANSGKKGGAVYAVGDYKVITLENCLFEKNTSTDNGSAVYVSGGSNYADKFVLQVKNTLFSENNASVNGTVYLTDTSAYFADSHFDKNTAAGDGAAIYLNASEADVDIGVFSLNTAGSGGAVALYEGSSAVMNAVTATKNTASEKGGFAVSDNSEIKVFDSSFGENKAASGGAMSLGKGTKAGVYNSSFTNNEALSADGGAIELCTSGAEAIVHSCSFNGNKAALSGGAMSVTSATTAKLYNLTATANRAKQGGFMYEADAGSEATLVGLTVSGNTAENGPIIYGGTADAVLNISKAKYTDSDRAEAPDDAYWKGAVANELTVNFIDAEIPNYAKYGNEEPGGMWNATDVETADGLEAALKEGKSEIRITASFELDRTFYVTNDTVIFSTKYIILKRAADFAGDIFVVGQSENGTPCSHEVTLSVGIPTSVKSDLLILDGNKDNMNVGVNGTVFFVCSEGRVKLYENLTVKNFKKTANERTLNTVHGVSYPEYVGGAVGILAKNAVMDIYGGTYSGNSGNDSGKSTYGGAFYNFGTMNVYGGVFKNNRASRAGVFYNYRVLNLYNAELTGNYAATNGGAIYMPASTGAFLYIGQEHDGVKGKVSFVSNSSAGNAGAIYANNSIKINNALFEKNKADNGGAVASYSAELKVDNSVFKSNTAILNGGAIYVTGKTSRKNAVELTLTDSEFTSNTSTVNGGAVYLVTDSASIIKNSSFTSNIAKADSEKSGLGGGAVCIVKAAAELDTVSFSKNSSMLNGGAVALSEAENVIFNKLTADSDKAENDGGFLYAEGSKPRIYESEISKASAENNGGAMAFTEGSESEIIKTAFTSDSAVNGGGAVYADTKTGNTFLHSCSFTENTSKKGGALQVTNESKLELYNAVARQNSAQYGGVLCVSGTGTTASVNGLTVSGNIASVEGEIIYSDATNGLININKANHTDEDLTGEADEAYWAGAISGTAEVKENSERIPGYAEPDNESFGYMWTAKDASSADELESLLSSGEPYIRIVADFELDRAFAVNKNAVIFSTAPHKLTRASDFGESIFRVSGDGQSKAVLAFGNSTSGTKDLLVIDGNKDGMTVDVTGGFVEVNSNGRLEAYDNLTLTGFATTALSVKGEAEINGGSFMGNAGENAGVIYNEGTVEINGGSFSDNTAAVKGGVILNRGTLTVNGGTFDSSFAENGGVICNEGTLNITAGSFSKNKAANGGVIYNEGALIIKGGTFASNTASLGAVIYNKGTLSTENAEYSSNKATVNGGVILSETSVTVSSGTFLSNKATGNGGAIYIEAQPDTQASLIITKADFYSNSALNGGAIYALKSKLTVTADFEENKATAGGAVYMGEGCDGDFTSVSSVSDSAKSNGGFLYCKGSNTSFNDCVIDGASAGKSGAAVYAETASSLDIASTAFTNSTAAENGGAVALCGESVSAKIEKSTFTGNNADEKGGAIYKSDLADTQITDSSFESCTALKGGAVYAEKGEINITSSSFNKNESKQDGGAIALEGKLKATLYDITAESNKADGMGGFMYAEDAAVSFESGMSTGNKAYDGGAVALEGDAALDCRNCEFLSDSAEKNGGAFYIKTDGTVTKISGCTFSTNSAKANGGALYICSGSTAELYNITASSNSAVYGGVMYITNTSTQVTLSGMTVSGNKATKDGYIIYGNSSRAVLRINKAAYVDSDKQGALDGTYWSKAIAGSLKVKEIDEKIPEYSDNAVKVHSAKELEAAINKNAKTIRIDADFEIDRTFYIKSDITIYSSTAHTLKRAANFGGDFFVVGETSTGENAFLNSRVVRLTLGNPLSDEENLLIIDGNKDGMKTQVNGSIFFVSQGAKVDLYDNVTVTNCYKQGNERSHIPAYKISRPNRVGGPVAIIASGMLTVYGGNYTNNKVNEEDSSTEEGRNSTIGGVFYNNSNLIIKGGNFVGNEAARGGIVYNYKVVKILAGTFRDNVATKNGAVYYAPSSPAIHFLVGNTEKDGEKVLIKNNTSKSNGGVFYSSHFSAILVYGNTSFKNNRVLSGNGGAISTIGTLTVKNAEFIGNSSTTYGGAVYLSRTNSDTITRLMHFEGCTFSENTSKNGGAVGMNSSAAKSYSKGSIATVDNCLFVSNKATSTGGAVYTDNLSDLTVKNSSFTGNKSSGEAGAMYFIGKSRITLENNIFLSNTAASHGGAISIRSANLTMNGDKLDGNTSKQNGGAMYVSYSSAQDINSHVTANNVKLTNNSGASGGAIYATRRAVEPDAVLINMSESSFEGNKATSSGGAVLLTAGIKTYFKDVSFINNSSASAGGAVTVGSSALFEIDKATFSGNTSAKGGALSIGASATALMNNITATENSTTGNGGFTYAEGGTLKLYSSTVSRNSAFAGGGAYLYTGASAVICNTKFQKNETYASSSGSVGNGGALFIYTGDKETVLHSCTFEENSSVGAGGAMYISGVSKVKLYNNTAKKNKAQTGGFIYETKAGTVVDVIGLTVSGNSAENGGSIIWGNTYNAVMNLDKAKYKDTSVASTDDAYWTKAIEGKLTVKSVSVRIPEADSYKSKVTPEKPVSGKVPVSVEDVFSLAKKSSDADIDEKYNKLKKLDNSSNFMSRSTKDYENINGKTVTVDTFVYPTKGKTDNGIVGLGILLYQALEYKKAYPKEEVYIDVSSYRFSVQSAVNINRNSRYFGYMRNLVGKNYDEYGFVRLSYLLITAAKMGIHVNVIGQLDAYPISKTNPNFYEYFTMQLSDPCDPKYAKGKVIGDFLDFNFCYWTLDAKGGTDMMHTKMCTVSHYLDKDGVAHKNAMWSSSSNLDGVKPDGQNANWKLQTASLVTNHDEIYRVATNYLRLISSLCGQEQIIEFQDTVNSRSTEQIALINQGRGNEIPKDEQVVYIGTENDKVFELYFTPLGGSIVAWDEVHNPYCKYLREMYESEDYILFTWNAAEYSGGFYLGRQIEEMIIRSFHENRNVKNKIYSYMESFDPTTFDDLVVGKDIGYKSFFEKPFGKVHNKDVQLSYVKDGQRYFVTLLNSLNFHSGSMSYQSNFILVVKETSCDENGVFSTIARYSTTGDIAAHTYGELKTKAATSKKDGYTYRECIYCGDKVKEEILHYSGEWVVDKKATTTETGLRHRNCKHCGELLQAEEIATKTVTVDYTELTGRKFSSSSKSPVKVSSDKLPLTIETRLRVPKNRTSSAGTVVGNYGVSSGNVISMEIVKNGRIKLYVKASGKTFTHTFKKDIRSDDAVDIAIRIASGKATLYVNGSKSETVKLSVTPKGPIKSLKIGGDNRKGNTNYFKGTLYSVNLFSNARTEAQIRKDRLVVRPDTSKLIYSAYYDGNDVRRGAVVTQLSAQTFSAKEVYKLNKELSATPKTIEATISLPKSVSGKGGVIFGNYNADYKAPFNLEIYTGGRVRLYFKNGKKTVSHIFKTDVRSDSGTVHIAVTLSGKTAVLYVNGVKAETAKLSASVPSVTKNFCVGGDNRKGNKNYFKGKLYSLNLFSDVRTASEIKQDRLAVTSKADKLMYSAYFIPDGSSSRVEKVTLKAQTFDADTKYSLPVLKAAPHTIEATVQLSKKLKGSGGVIVGNNDGKGGNYLNVSVTDKGRVKLSFKNGKTAVAHEFSQDIRTSSAPVNIALTLDGKKATLYINGAKAETAKLKKSVPALTEGFVIGGDKRSSGSQYFRGKIYSVNLFGDVRTASEIKKDVTYVSAKASSLIYSAYFYATKCTVTSVGKTHTASSWKTAYPATTSECGVKVKKCTACGKILETAEIRKKGTSLSSADYLAYNGKTFSKKGDAVSVKKTVPGKAFTVEAMLQLSPEISDRAGTVIGNYDGSDSSQLNIEAYSDGKIRLYYKVGSKSYTHVFSPDIRSEKKVHIALTFEGKTVKLYVNGKLKDSCKLETELPKSIKNLKIGADNRSGEGKPFKGRIYSVYLFDTVRTASQIVTDRYTVMSKKSSVIYKGVFG